ncbi:MAG: hypothetical protein JWL69_2939 [Phycisphaerales bacterium]|nr:hypothetical protein [Phycisphaerales bacterium]
MPKSDAAAACKSHSRNTRGSFLRRAAIWVGLALAGLTLPAWRADAAPASQPAVGEAARAAALIDQLNDPDAEARHAAGLQLNSLGGEALPVVEAALKGEELTPEERVRLNAAAKILRPRAVREARMRERQKWETAAFINGYDTGGKADTKYNALAHNAIALYLQLGPDPVHGPTEPREKALAALIATLKAGCEDPIIQSMYCIVDGHYPGANSGLGVGIGHSANLCLAGHCSAAVKVRLWSGYLRMAGHARQDEWARTGKVLAELAREPGVPPAEIDVVADEYLNVAFVERSSLEARDEYLDAYAAAAPNSVNVLVQRGRSAMNVANWLSRDFELGDNRPERKQEFKECMAAAPKCLEEAWKKDPSDFRAAVWMLKLICNLGEEAGGRDAMELWFRRATEANPDNYLPYQDKLRYLRLNSRDTYDTEAVALGRECLRTENWRAGIPSLLVEVHDTLAEASGDSGEYYSRPQVWADLSAVYEGGLLNFPAAVRMRCQYAKVAAKCGHWDVADRQFKKIGDAPDLAVFGSRTSFEYLRKKAARMASEKPQPSPEAQPQPDPAAVK